MAPAIKALAAAHLFKLTASTKALARKAGVVGSGRAWYAKRGGNLGDAAVPVRVLADRAMNDSAASALPPRCNRRRLFADVRQQQGPRRPPPLINPA